MGLSMVEILEANKDGATFRRDRARTFEFNPGPDTEKPIIVQTIQRMSHDVTLSAKDVERLADINSHDSEVMREAWAAIHEAQISSKKAMQEQRVEPAGTAKEAWNAIQRAQISSKREFAGSDQEPAITAAARETPKGPKI